MADDDVKRYEKELAKWKKRAEDIHNKYLREIKDDLETIKIINETIKEVKRRKEGGEQEIPVKPIDELVKDREKLQKKIANKTFDRNYQVLKELPPKRPDDAPKSDLKGFLQQLIKKGGIPAGSGAVIKPEPGQDEMKINVEWESD